MLAVDIPSPLRLGLLVVYLVEVFPPFVELVEWLARELIHYLRRHIAIIVFVLELICASSLHISE